MRLSFSFDGLPDLVTGCRGSVRYFTLGTAGSRFDVQDLGIDDLGRRDFGSWPVAEFRTVMERCLDWAVSGAFPG